jgi:hypothetical protein
LSNKDANKIAERVPHLLKPNGKIITADPCRFEEMSYFEKLMIKHDRGRNIRSADQYKQIFRNSFSLNTEEIGVFGNIPQRDALFAYEKNK